MAVKFSATLSWNLDVQRLAFRQWTSAQQLCALVDGSNANTRARLTYLAGNGCSVNILDGSCGSKAVIRDKRASQCWCPLQTPSSMQGGRMHGLGEDAEHRLAKAHALPGLCREIVFQHGTVADLALTQSVQRLVDLGHREHLHHRLDVMARTEIEHACAGGR